MPLQTADILIVGGGVVGSSTAYFLTAHPGFHGRVVVVEKDPTYGEAATARSAGGVRQQFSTPENIRMSQFGASFIKNVAEHLSLAGEKAQLPFVEQGYLFLATPSGLPVLEQNHATQTALGADIVMLDPPALRRQFPWLHTDDLAGGAFGRRNEGWTDPYSLLQAFRRKAIAQGAVYIQDEAVALQREGDRIASVTLAKAGTIAVGAMVNSAGINAARVAGWAGFDLPVRPRKRFVYVFDCRDSAEIQKGPLLIDPNGVYFRPEGASFIGGVSPPEDQDPDCTDLEVEYGLFEDTVWPTLAQRVPAFEAIKLVRAWAGHYDYNTLDQNLIIGRGPGLANFYMANGLSGHGLQQSPAIGRALGEMILDGAFKSIDLTRFGYERVARNQPLAELNVV
ncbi:FAD-dependent oxidoreductase [Hypericibacter terrae]|jgi:sarcosine oxidase|uniref:FAD-dependent oxidoreductase n=1 Tax=Hypericibacter terrae TaxID=2602015 RepID=A0A5J6MHG6_9PROT|nr:FAD-binding oxidoreductase [Hypericibacter terrae]QEX16958.1 FAD-dependent oxidoreductase [Hypericibacter terrae]